MGASWTMVAAAVLAAAPTTPAAVPELAAGVPIEAGGELISVDVGHAAPFVYDLDGNGQPDLLVGQFGGGKLRVYPNAGSASEPQFESYEYLQAGGSDATVPYG